MGRRIPKANAKAISALTSVKSDYTYTPPEGQKWNVSYDMWVAQSKDISAPESNTLEVMVWLDYSTASTTNPIGSPVADGVNIGGNSWQVWYGTTGSAPPSIARQGTIHMTRNRSM